MGLRRSATNHNANNNLTKVHWLRTQVPTVCLIVTSICGFNACTLEPTPSLSTAATNSPTPPSTATPAPTPIPTDTPLIDDDNDGYPSQEDCDDLEPQVNPGATEVCGNGIDDNCDGGPDDCLFFDQDGDGITGFDGDCDDTNPEINPTLSDICENGVDEDCSGEDRVCGVEDNDGDGFSEAQGDCNDDNETVYPQAEEVCDDGLVNDCDSTPETAKSTCQLLGEWSLGASGLTLIGESEGDLAGNSVSIAGDVDGDGLDDILVGAFSNDGGGDGSGAVYLLLSSGALKDRSDDLDLPLELADLKLVGENDTVWAGVSTAGAGDVDGDGLADVLVGASNTTVGDNRRGVAYLLLSSGALKHARGTLSLGVADLKLIDEESGDKAGSTVSSAGDVDGDGLADILVGADRTYDPEGERTYLLLTTGALQDAHGSLDLSLSDVKLVGGVNGYYMGQPRAATGDIDGDGLADLLISVQQSDTSGGVTTMAYVMLSSGALKHERGLLDLSYADIKINSGEPSQYGATSVSSAGDVDGDGRADVLLSSTSSDSDVSSAGAAYLLLTTGSLNNVAGTVNLSDADLKLIGEEPGDYAGSSLSSAEDVDGDGLADLLIGAQGHNHAGASSGAAYLLLTSGALKNATGELNLSDADLKLFGEGEVGLAGKSVSSAGDVDGNGLGDLLIGAPGSYLNGQGSGAAFLIYSHTY